MKSKKQQKKLNESFDPTSLDDYEKDWGRKESPDLETVNIEQLLKGRSTAEALNESQKVSGYRVQLIATRDEKEAHAVMREAILTFEYRVYRTFDDPYYKVRIGDFVSRMKADQVREQAIQNDYLEAWVVRERVWKGEPLETTEAEADTTGI
ncbi:MAG: SPOR domain-containing protein [candidate division KSB1 bacterium]|nr:SPOR domain-containing protein [candidate division KSB1 bacterium]